MGENEDYYSHRSACMRCHAQKLRCSRERGHLDCVRCIRSNAHCVPRPSKRTIQGRSFTQSDPTQRLPTTERSVRPAGTAQDVAASRDPVLDWDMGVVELSTYSSASASAGGMSSQYPDLLAEDITAVDGPQSNVLSALALSGMDPNHSHSPAGPDIHQRGTDLGPEEWTCDFASLNSQIYQHRKSMTDSVRAFQSLCGTLDAAEPQRTNHLEVAHQGGHRLPIDESLLLALQLLNLLSHNGHDIAADPATSLLVISCYAGLATTLSDLLTRLSDLLTRARDIQGLLSPLSIVNLALPSVDIGGLSLHLGVAPRLRALTVLDMGEHLMRDIAGRIEATLEDKNSSGLDGGSCGQDGAAASVIEATLRVVRDQQAVFSRSVSKVRDIL